MSNIKVKAICGALVVLLGYAPVSAKVIAPTQEKTHYEVLLDNWIEDLVQAESNGREDIIILDVNNRYSRGCLQFQDATFEHYTKRYGIEGDIMDCGFQKRLARLMIKENPDNWKHWWNSVRHKVGLPPIDNRAKKG